LRNCPDFNSSPHQDDVREGRAATLKFEKDRADVNISLHPLFGDKFSFTPEGAINGHSP
jgi:hypothetical protein